MSNGKDKPAPVAHEVLPLIKNRWSPRAFQNKPVENEKLQRLFEAARWAPSAFNGQPWSFVVCRNGDETFAKLFPVFTESNQKWVKNVPVLGITVANLLTPKGTPNPTALYDLGQSIGLLLLQAEHEGLIVHQMSGLDTEQAGLLLQVPNGYKVVTAFAIGYYGDFEKLHEDFRTKESLPRVRKDQREFVFAGKFGGDYFFNK